MTRGGHGGDGSTCDSGGRGSWWLSRAASVEEGWGGFNVKHRPTLVSVTRSRSRNDRRGFNDA